MNSEDPNQLEITCPQCDSKLHTSVDEIGVNGRKIRCGKCKHVWQYFLVENKPNSQDDEIGKMHQELDILEPDKIISEDQASSNLNDDSQPPPESEDLSQGSEIIANDEVAADQTDDPLLSALAAADKKSKKSQNLIGDPFPEKINLMSKEHKTKKNIKEQNNDSLTDALDDKTSNIGDDQAEVDQDKLAADWEASVMGEMSDEYENDDKTVESDKDIFSSPEIKDTNGDISLDKPTAKVDDEKVNEETEVDQDKLAEDWEASVMGDMSDEYENNDDKNQTETQTEDQKDEAQIDQDKLAADWEASVMAKEPDESVEIESDEKIVASEEQITSMLDAISEPETESETEPKVEPKIVAKPDKEEIDAAEAFTDSAKIINDGSSYKEKKEKKSKFNLLSLFGKKSKNDIAKPRSKKQGTVLEVESTDKYVDPSNFSKEGSDKNINDTWQKNANTKDDLEQSFETSKIKDKPKTEKVEEVEDSGNIRSILKRREFEEKQSIKEKEKKRVAEVIKQRNLEYSSRYNQLNYTLTPLFSIVSYFTLIVFVLLMYFLTTNFRNNIVAIYPELGLVFRDYGFDVYIAQENIEVSYVDYKITPTSEDNQTIDIQAQIKNTYAEEIEVPDLLVTIYNAQERVVDQWILNTDKTILKPGQSFVFSSDKRKISEYAESIEVSVVIDPKTVQVSGLGGLATKR